MKMRIRRVLSIAILISVVFSGSACTLQTSANESNETKQSLANSSSEGRISALLTVMENEIGNTDGSKYENALLDVGGELCYERGYWCATYIWWAFREAGLSPYFCDGQMIVYPQRQAAYFESQGLYHETADENWHPERGDIAFMFYNDGFPGGEIISHSEFVISYDAETRTVETISANPVVEYHTHPLNGEDMRGFGDVLYE